MSVVVILVIVGVVVAGGFLLAFVWSVKSGQYDDTYSPAVRILFEDTKPVDHEILIGNQDSAGKQKIEDDKNESSSNK